MRARGARLVAAAAALALGACGAPERPAGPPQRPPASEPGAVRLGVHVRELSSVQADRIARGGARMVRTTLQWDDAERRRGGRYDWSHFDSILRTAASRGLEVLPVLIGSPAWAAPRPSYPPLARERGGWEAFVAAAVERYGPGGHFWDAHRGLPRRPVRAWQVWNEPNLPAFWGGPADPIAYAALLRSTRAAIRSADPRARIVLAGMPRSEVEHPIDGYLRELYRVPGFAKLFDVGAVHAYEADATAVAALVRDVRELLDRNGDEDKPIWVTELGWASAGPDSDPVRVKEPGEQAALAGAAIGALERQAPRTRLGLIVWYDLQDYPRPLDEPDRFAWHTGLFAADGEPKPVWRSFVEAAGGHPGQGSLPRR